MTTIYLCGLITTENHYIKKTLNYLNNYALPYLFCLLCIVSISFIASIGYTSRLLSLLGCLSYELYLIHGPLLVKYNPVVSYFNNRFMLIGVFLWFGAALGLAYTLKIGTSLSNSLPYWPINRNK
jgi:peptidoglycan/LPS O-acetylase OafA/YrhL